MESGREERAENSEGQEEVQFYLNLIYNLYSKLRENTENHRACYKD